MLRSFFIFLLSLILFNIVVTTNFFKLADASQIKIIPEKRPINLFEYENSLESLNDIILKEGGRKIFQIQKAYLKNGENLSMLLKRVGFKNKEISSIVDIIKIQFPNNNILRKLPIKHQINFALPISDLGYGINFRLQNDKDVYVWKSESNELKFKITKRPSAEIMALKQLKITNNLYKSAEDKKLPKKIFFEMATILGFVIDFQRELRRGDQFKVFYTKKIDLLNNNVIAIRPIEFISATLKKRNFKFYRYTSKNGFTGYYDENGRSSKKTLMKTPLNGARLSSKYGNRKHPILGYTKMHRGVDFAAPKGTPILAAGDGIIDYAGWNGSYGKYIRIRHNSSYKTVYAHLSKILKSRNSKVNQGDVIGLLGSTGRSTGPHLHYEVLLNNKQINPMKIKLPSGKRIPDGEMKYFKTEIDKIKKSISKLNYKDRINSMASINTEKLVNSYLNPIVVGINF